MRFHSQIGLSSRVLAVTALFLSVVAAPAGAKPAPPETGDGPTFGWEVTPGVNANEFKDGGISLLDGGTTASAVGRLPLSATEQPVLRLSLDGCAVAKTVTFAIDGSPVPPVWPAVQPCAAVVGVLEGEHEVEMTVPGATSSVVTTKRINVVHHVIVGLGDSYASGEGVTPRYDTKYNGTRGEPLWADRNCRRSDASPQARAAKALEDSDPHSAVTFIVVSCSGATIPDGLLGPQLKPPGGIPQTDSQLSQAANLARGLKVDRVLLSIGGNDIGFPDIVKKCGSVSACPLSSEGVDRPTLHETVQTSLAKLPDTYRTVAKELRTLVDNPAKVLHTEYPWVSTTTSKRGDTIQSPSGKTNYCHGDLPVPIDVAKKRLAEGNGIQDDEYAWATEVVQDGDPLLTPVWDYVEHGQVAGPPLTVRQRGLNTLIRSAPTGFTPVVGAENLFDGHGYCAGENSRYITQLDEFFKPLDVTGIGNGPMHPNLKGQEEWGTLLGSALVREIARDLPPIGVIRPSEATISAGAGHTCALPGDGTAKCWGSNNLGQLGNGTTTDSSVPVTVAAVAGATAVSAGWDSTCAVLSDGTARCWGENSFGQLGDGTTARSSTPVTVAGLSDAIDIAAGALHTCALLRDGSVSCWGYNRQGQLGGGTLPAYGMPDKALTPVAVTGLIGVVAIDAGDLHTCALLEDGTARCWGANWDGQLGDGTTIDSATPVTAGIHGLIAIDSGGQHTCALVTEGTAYCWGDSYGAVGDPSGTDLLAPVSVLSGATAITAGGVHSCVLLRDGTARCWGDNSWGQLGDGTTLESSTPVPAMGGTAITAGGGHTCVLRSDGTVRCWGWITS